MFKRLLSLAVALTTMASAFTSCSGSDDEKKFGPEGGYCSAIYFVGEESEYDYFNPEYILKAGTKSVTLNLKDMVKTTVGLSQDALKAVQAAKEEGFNPTMYNYVIPSDIHGKIAIYPNYTIKDGVELPEKCNVLMCAYPYQSGVGNVFMMPGLAKDRVADYINRHKDSPILRAKAK